MGRTIENERPLECTFTVALASGYNGYPAPPGPFEFGGHTTWRACSSHVAVDAEPGIGQMTLSPLNRAAVPR